MIDIWKSKPNNGLPFEVIFMDLSEPFDCSNHNLLLVNLMFMDLVKVLVDS